MRAQTIARKTSKRILNPELKKAATKTSCGFFIMQRLQTGFYTQADRFQNVAAMRKMLKYAQPFFTCRLNVTAHPPCSNVPAKKHFSPFCIYCALGLDSPPGMSSTIFYPRARLRLRGLNTHNLPERLQKTQKSTAATQTPKPANI